MADETIQEAPKDLIRAISSRAPFRRGGLAFAPNAREVTVPAAELSAGQLEQLASDPVISLLQSGDGGLTWASYVMPAKAASERAARSKRAAK